MRLGSNWDDQATSANVNLPAATENEPDTLGNRQLVAADVVAYGSKRFYVGAIDKHSLSVTDF